MNKKLMAVAVAAAVAAPAAALAQVTISGKFNIEYGFVSQQDDVTGGSRPNADAFNSGASNIRLAGTENLGGGLSAWFQCETRARLGADVNPAQTQAGICDRNTGVGLKGNFGNFFVGTWDTAVENSSGDTRLTGSNGWNGVQRFLTESSNAQQGVSFQFAQRVQNSINYYSPNFGGFSVDLSTTSKNAAINTTAAGAVGKEGRIMSVLGKYAGGPILAYVGYEKHDDNQAQVSGGLNGASETMTTVGASYVFGPVKVAMVYTDIDADAAVAGTEVTRRSWQLGADWKVTGPGTVRVVYTNADDFKGNAAAAALPDQGAQQYLIGYLHAMSKRTTVGVSYVGVKNDTNGAYGFAGHTASTVKLGDDGSVIALSVSHSF
jgi:predicted porin